MLLHFSLVETSSVRDKITVNRTFFSGPPYSAPSQHTQGIPGPDEPRDHRVQELGYSERSPVPQGLSLILFFLSFGLHLRMLRGLLLALCFGIIPGVLRMTMWDAEDQT